VLQGVPAQPLGGDADVYRGGAGLRVALNMWAASGPYNLKAWRRARRPSCHHRSCPRPSCP
jgi:hypothetical protein